MNILAFSGSLRAASFNTALARAAVELAPAGMTVELYDGLRAIPPYDGDVDGDAPPQSVLDLRARIAAADGLLICSPEYNYGVPGVLKNAIDWASRPAPDSSLRNKPIALASAAPGAFGGVRAQLAWRQAFLWTESRVVLKPEVLVFQAASKFEDGRLVDETSRTLLTGLLESLATEIRTTRHRVSS
jgi:chromate reductase